MMRKDTRRKKELYSKWRNSHHRSNRHNVFLIMLIKLLIPPLVLAIPHIVDIVKEHLDHHTESCPLYESGDGISIPKLDDFNSISDIRESGASRADMCQLLGPELVQDGMVHQLPQKFKRPSNLENIIKLDLPVGYLRLRRALLSDDADFWKHKVLDMTLKYKNVVSHGWDHHQSVIGSPIMPRNIHNEDIVGATRKTEYLMPGTALVKENMAYETATLTDYNEHFFALDIFTSNPDVPFGKRFNAHTKIVVYNTGENTCHMECSVEADWVDTPPRGFAWQIKRAMKDGSIDVFQKIGESIKNCAIN